MDEKVRRLAEKAGFIFWGNEAWKPHGATIDWSCDYDAELQKFYELLEEHFRLNAELQKFYELLEEHFRIKYEDH